jgi:hypothetical protein
LLFANSTDLTMDLTGVGVKKTHVDILPDCRPESQPPGTSSEGAAGTIMNGFTA